MAYIEIFYSILIFIFGLCVGSFLNCVIYRLKKNKSLKGRSFCPCCEHKLSWKDLFPIFSFLFLKGKCRYCKTKISVQYPLVEITTSVIFLLIFNFQFLIFNEFLNVSIFQFLNLLFLFYIASVLVVIFVFDLKHYLIPDKVLFPAIIIAFVYRVLGNWKLPAWPVGREIGNLTFVLNYFYAILAGAGFFFLLWLISKGKWMGFGDVKLAVLLGLILGFPNILAALFSAFFIGSVVSIFLMAKKIKGMKSEVPFAPFLIAGTFIAMFWGDKIISWYLNLII